MIDLKIVTIPPILRTQRYVVTKIVINDKGSPTKPPTSVVTGKLHDCWKSTPDALVTIEEAIAFANEKGYDFVFGYNRGGLSCASILDNCFQPDGELKLWARVFVDTWNDFVFYAERSPGVLRITAFTCGFESIRKTPLGSRSGWPVLEKRKS